MLRSSTRRAGSIPLQHHLDQDHFGLLHQHHLPAHTHCRRPLHHRHRLLLCLLRLCLVARRRLRCRHRRHHLRLGCALGFTIRGPTAIVVMAPRTLHRGRRQTWTSPRARHRASSSLAARPSWCPPKSWDGESLVTEGAKWIWQGVLPMLVRGPATTIPTLSHRCRPFHPLCPTRQLHRHAPFILHHLQVSSMHGLRPTPACLCTYSTRTYSSTARCRG